MNKSIMLGTIILILSGCGGSGSSSEPIIPVVDTPPVVDDTPMVDTPSNNITPALFPPVTSSITCEGLDYIHLISAQSDATPSSITLSADNAIDNQLTDDGRWETTDTTAALTIDLGYRHKIREIGTAWYQGDESSISFTIEVSEDGITYTPISTPSTFESSGETESIERFEISESVARFVRITDFINTTTNTVSLLEAAVFGCPLDTNIAPLNEQTVNIAQFNLDPSIPPGENFNLLTWALDTPEQDPDAAEGESLRTSEVDLDNGHEDDFFFTADDGGMVFKATIAGAKTSTNTSFTRSELREQLRAGDTGISTQGVNANNWVLGYQPETPRPTGGRGGRLSATLKVDHVATTGTEQHEGRFIIGQIHASDDEPIRLYFKKFANNERGYIYFASEIRASDANNNESTDNWFMVVGNDNANRDQEDQPIFTENPEQGIALGEIFSYEIDQTGSRIDVIVRRGDLNGPIIGHNFVDMAELNSGYDVVEEWNYFKAGTYVQNNTGDDDDFYQTTFYALSNTHDENTLIGELPTLVAADGETIGNQFASITDSSSTDTGELRYELPSSLAQGRLEVTFTRTDDDTGNTDGFISLFNENNNNNGAILDLRVRDDSFQTRSPSFNVNTDDIEVTPNVFQTAVITWEYPSGDTTQLPSVTVEIDGIDIISGNTTTTSFTPTNISTGGVETISFRFGSNDVQVPSEARFVIDQFSIYDNIAGTGTVIFSDDFESRADGDNLEEASDYDNNGTSEATVITE